MSYTLAYDEENRIETVTDTQASQTWTFHYDGNGTRVRQVNPDGSQLLLLNGGRYHVEIAADTTISTTRYYSIAGQRPAMRNSDGSINYLLGDHLGSVSTVVDASGQIISQSRYLPFGEVLWEDGTSPTDYTYTGQRSLSDIGLMDYNARFYDPMLGRFTSPDSIVPDPGSVIGYNRFAYVNNNPMIYTDPSGHRIADEPGYVAPTSTTLQEAPPPDICTLSLQLGGATGGSGIVKKFWSFDIVVTRKTDSENSKMAFYLSQSVNHQATESDIPLYYGEEVLSNLESQGKSPYRIAGEGQGGLSQAGISINFGKYYSPKFLSQGINVYRGPSIHTGGSLIAVGIETSESVDPITGDVNDTLWGYDIGYGVYGALPAEVHRFAYDSQPINEMIYDTPNWLYSILFDGLVSTSENYSFMYR